MDLTVDVGKDLQPEFSTRNDKPKYTSRNPDKNEEIDNYPLR